ncbi:MAG: hypothetical protein MJ060_03870 [Clostridia bacterium]|nr:hypothetical protein [Clostridia bacterium]
MKIGKNEPCIFVYYNGTNCYNEIGVSLDDIIIDFNKFYADFDSLIKDKK